MMKKSIGQFIAALRKANGYTQQDIADRLNVSNKAVSRWERDECSPDISVIPALAELLGVSCDELLRGERIIYRDTAEEKEQRTDKQVKSLINRTLSGFKTLIWIALALAAVGLILMFGIAYGFYRPVIGFTVMLLFEASAAALTVLAITRARDAVRDNELFESAGTAEKARFNSTLGEFSYWSFYSVFASVMFSLPFILIRSDIVSSVIPPSTYFTVFFSGTVLVLLLIYIKCKEPYISLITDGKPLKKEPAQSSGALKKLNLIQLGAIALASLTFIIAPYFVSSRDESDTGFTVVIALGFLFMAASTVFFIILTVRNREERRSLLAAGIRNTVLLPTAVIISNAHSVGWSGAGDLFDGIRHDFWNAEYILFALAYFFTVFSLFELSRILLRHFKK